MFGESFENFTINFNALNPKATFSGGDVMSGQVSFDLTKEAKIQTIMIEMKGRANVLWHEQRGGRGPTRSGAGIHHRRRRSPGGGRRQRATYSAELKFFNLNNIVLQSNNADGHTVLPPGKHVFPFTVQLPHGDFPPSFHGLHGKIVYSMVVAIHRPWHMAKEFDTEVRFASRTDANHPHMRMPLTGSNAKTLCCLFCTSGPVSINAQLERKGYSPGENIKIIAEIGNVSNRTVTPYAKLVLEEIFYTSNRGKRKYHSKLLHRKDGQSIGPNTSDVHSEILLPIPQNTTLTIANCQIIDVQYYVMVALDISRSSALEVKFPISLCSIPFNPNQPPTTVAPQQSHPGQYPAQYGPQPGPQPGAYPAPQPGGQYPAPQPGAYPAPQPGGQYPAPQPGAYPAPQPGQYPAPQPGAYPAPQPGAYPAPQPGAYPAPQPGAYAAPQPGAYPNPQPGAYPNPQPGAYPAPQPRQYPNQPGPYPAPQPQPGPYPNPQPGLYPNPQPGPPPK